MSALSLSLSLSLSLPLAAVAKVAEVAAHHLEASEVASRGIKHCHYQGGIWHKLLLPILPEPNRVASKGIKCCHNRGGKVVEATSSRSIRSWGYGPLK